MAQFKSGALPVLVATTVIEVGVDVPNASLMVIEHAERFGLAQLHQLRGRVGRGSAASVCVLLYAPPLSLVGKERLKAMAETIRRLRDCPARPADPRARASSWARASRATSCCASPTWRRTRRCWPTCAEVAPALLARAPGAASAHVERWLGGKLEWMKA